MPRQTDSPLAFCRHDHASCASGVLDHVDRLAAKNGLRLTPVRRRTLEILLEAHQAMGAYDVLERLSADGFGTQPPVAYRALEFLVEHGFVHRIRRLNAFTACMQPGREHRPVFFICTACSSVAEAAAGAVQASLEAAALGLGFQIERMNLEAIGLCPACQEHPA